MSLSHYSFPNVFLPDTISQNYVLKSILKISTHSILARITYTKENTDYFLKILPKSYVYSPLYDHINTLPKQDFLLPIDQVPSKNYYYYIFPEKYSLASFLQKEEMSLSFIHKFSFSVSHCIYTLHKNNILHNDISFENIYVTEHNGFLLGDFSSATFMNLFPLKKIFHHKMYQRSLTTKDFCRLRNLYHIESPSSYDWFHFIILLYYLLNQKTPTPDIDRFQEKSSPFAPMNDFLLSSINLLTKDCFVESAFLEKLEDVWAKHFPNDIPAVISPKCIHSSSFVTGTTVSISNVPRVALSSLFCFLLCLTLFFTSLFYYFSSTKFHNDPDQYVVASTSSPWAKEKPSSKKTSPPKYFTPAPSPSLVSFITPTPRGSHCRVLDISNSSYKDTNSFSCDTPHLVQILFAHNNRFHSMNFLKHYSHLTELYAAGNSISSLTYIGKISSLKVLVLSHNSLKNISLLGNLSSLEILDLSENRHLTKIMSLKKLKKLHYLILTNTNVSPKEIQDLKKKLPQCTILY